MFRLTIVNIDRYEIDVQGAIPFIGYLYEIDFDPLNLSKNLINRSNSIAITKNVNVVHLTVQSSLGLDHQVFDNLSIKKKMHFYQIGS